MAFGFNVRKERLVEGEECTDTRVDKERRIVLVLPCPLKGHLNHADGHILVTPVDSSTVFAARESYFRYGRGWHAAKLTFADCFAYALAKMRDEPLLFKGDDFAQNDIVPAWRP